MANNVSVHMAHCCKFHGCLYTLPAASKCPVTDGEVVQLYPCEQCDEVIESGLPWLMNEMFNLGWKAADRRTSQMFKGLTGYMS